jgi:hypothetical protein
MKNLGGSQGNGHNIFLDCSDVLESLEINDNDERTIIKKENKL